LLQLNAAQPFDIERDPSWDLAGRATEFPDVRYALSLSEDERKALVDYHADLVHLRSLAAFREGIERGDDERPLTEPSTDGLPDASPSADAATESASISTSSGERSEKAGTAHQRALLVQADELRVRARLRG